MEYQDSQGGTADYAGSGYWDFRNGYLIIDITGYPKKYKVHTEDTVSRYQAMYSLRLNEAGELIAFRESGDEIFHEDGMGFSTLMLAHQ